MAILLNKITLQISTSDKLRRKLFEIIYGVDTPAGKLFDLLLLLVILISVAAVMLESVASVQLKYGHELAIIEWIITIFFTLEYIGRMYAVKKPLKYILSFYGLIDLLSTLPFYIDLLFPGFRFLISLRAIRLLRVFRILKLVQFVGAGNSLVEALKKSKNKIAVFLFAVIVACIILGTIMYIIEGPGNGFSSIPMSVYWTVVTLTTVGFGDITPQTPLGQLISVIIMILGYGIIAIPTGLITAEFMAKEAKADANARSCPNCAATSHLSDAKYCYHCAASLKF